MKRTSPSVLRHHQQKRRRWEDEAGEEDGGGGDEHDQHQVGEGAEAEAEEGLITEAELNAHQKRTWRQLRIAELYVTVFPSNFSSNNAPEAFFNIKFLLLMPPIGFY
jgi:hypothetical protein